MRIAVSGANGFIGSWICRILGTTNEVFGLVRPYANIKRLEGIPGLKVHKVTDSDFNSFILNQRIEMAILCDWWGVENQHRNDERQFENLIRYQNRISSLREIGNVLVLGSQAELGPQQEPITEECNASPLTKYGHAKSEVLDYLGSNLGPDIRFVWGRVFSSYGPLDSNTWFIPSTILKLLKGEKAQLTKGVQEWSFLHAYDLGCAIEAIVLNPNISGVVNIGNPNTVRIRDVAKMIEGMVGKKGLLDFGVLPYRDDQVMKMIPITKKLNDAGWSPNIRIEDGISHLIDWMLGKKQSNLITSEGSHLSLDLPSFQSMNCPAI